MMTEVSFLSEYPFKVNTKEDIFKYCMFQLFLTIELK